MSKFKAEVTLTYIAEYDDDELQLMSYLSHNTQGEEDG